MNPVSMMCYALLSVVLIIFLTSRLRLHAFYSLILVALALALVTLPVQEVVGVLKNGFGQTLSAIGLIILFGTTIGVFLDRTGAAWSMAHFVLRLTGPTKAPRAIAITGFFAGLPIFCDSGFIVLSGLNKSLARSSRTAMVRMAATLALALYTLHCLIPPHPGITAATGIVNGSAGSLVLFGTLIAVPAVGVGYAWVKWMSRAYKPGDSAQPQDVMPEKTPPAWLSFLPVLAPLLLISANSVTNLLKNPIAGGFGTALKFAGDPVIALLIGVLLCLPLLRGRTFGDTNAMLGQAVEKAGPILVITAAGGAFGAVIKAAGFGPQVSSLLGATSLGLLVPYLIAVLLKTAQGSSTVAAITTASIVAPMFPSLGLESDSGRTLALLAIGSGSMMISHANDSFFWVITRFSEIPSPATLRVYTSGTIVVSLFSFLLTWVLSLLTH